MILSFFLIPYNVAAPSPYSGHWSGWFSQTETEAPLFLPDSLPSAKWGPLCLSEHQPALEALWECALGSGFPSFPFLLPLPTPLACCRPCFLYLCRPVKGLNQDFEFSCARTGKSHWGKRWKHKSSFVSVLEPLLSQETEQIRRRRPNDGFSDGGYYCLLTDSQAVSPQPTKHATFSSRTTKPLLVEKVTKKGLCPGLPVAFHRSMTRTVLMTQPRLLQGFRMGLTAASLFPENLISR